MAKFNILAAFCGGVGLFESYLVRNLNDRFSHVDAHFVIWIHFMEACLFDYIYTFHLFMKRS